MPFATSLADTLVDNGDIMVGEQIGATWTWKRTGRRVEATGNATADRARLLAAVAQYPGELLLVDDRFAPLRIHSDTSIGGCSLEGYQGRKARIDLGTSGIIRRGNTFSWPQLRDNGSALTVDVPADGTFLDITGSGLSVSQGDTLLITSNAALPGDSHAGPGTTGVTRPLEWALVDDVQGNIVHLSRALVDAAYYTVAANAKVINVSTDANVLGTFGGHFRNLDFSLSQRTGTFAEGVVLQNCHRFTMENVNSTNAGSIHFKGGSRILVDQWRCDHQLGDNELYGIAVSSVGAVKITNFLVHDGCRHPFTTGAIDDIADTGSVNYNRYATNHDILLEDGILFFTGNNSSSAQTCLDTHAEGYRVTFRRVTVVMGGDTTASSRVLYAFQCRSRFTIFDDCDVIGKVGIRNVGWRIKGGGTTSKVLGCRMNGGFAGVICEPLDAGPTAVGDSPTVEIDRCHFRNLRNNGAIIDGGAGHRICRNTFENVGAIAGGLFGGTQAAISLHNRSLKGLSNVAVIGNTFDRVTNVEAVTIDDVLNASDLEYRDNRTDDWTDCSMGINRSYANIGEVIRRWASYNNVGQDIHVVTLTGHSLTVADNQYQPILRSGTVHDDTVAITSDDDILGPLLDVLGDTVCIAPEGYAVEMPNEWFPQTYNYGSDPLRIYFDADQNSGHGTPKVGSYHTNNSGDPSNPAIFKVLNRDGNNTRVRVVLGTSVGSPGGGSVTIGPDGNSPIALTSDGQASVTLAGSPQTQYHVHAQFEGGPVLAPGYDYTLAGSTLTFAAHIQALTKNGDLLHVITTTT